MSNDQHQLSYADYEPDPLETYALLYDPDYVDTSTIRRSRKASSAKQSQQDVVSALTDQAEGLEAGFEITYRPARYERVWLLSSLRSFYDQALITRRGRAGQGRQGGQRLSLRGPSVDRRRLPGRQGLPAADVPQPAQRQDVPGGAQDPRSRRKNAQGTRRAPATCAGEGDGLRRADVAYFMAHVRVLRRWTTSTGPRGCTQGLRRCENAILMAYIGDDHCPRPSFSR